MLLRNVSPMFHHSSETSGTMPRGYACISHRIAPCRIALHSRPSYRAVNVSGEVCSASDAQTYAGISPEDVSIRIINGPSECLQVANLRADAFYQVQTADTLRHACKLTYGIIMDPGCQGRVMGHGSWVMGRVIPLFG